MDRAYLRGLITPEIVEFPEETHGYLMSLKIIFYGKNMKRMKTQICLATMTALNNNGDSLSCCYNKGLFFLKYFGEA